MRQVAAVEIPARGEARLAPGGLHIMLIGLSEPLREDAGFPLTLVFERAGEVTVEVAVERSPPAAAAVDPHGSHTPPDSSGHHPHHDGGAAAAHGDGHPAGHHAPAR
jgi:copper(I)-binding protein